MGGIYRGEVYDSGSEGTNFRLKPVGEAAVKIGFDFQFAENDDPSKLANVVKRIRAEGGSITFPTTEEIRASFEGCNGIPKSQIDRMRGFTADEQRRVLGQ